MLTSGRGGDRLDAADAFQRLAAVAANRPAPPDVRDGGYWYVRDREDVAHEWSGMRWRRNTVHETWLDADGNGRYRTTEEGPVRFLTDAGRERWERLGRPELPSQAGAGPFRRWREWTLHNLYGLPGEPGALARRLHKYDDFVRRAPSRFSSFTGLLATMPLPGHVRAGLFELLAREPGIDVDSSARGLWTVGRGSMRALIDPRTSAVVGIDGVREYVAAGRVRDTRTRAPAGLAAP